MTDNIYHAHSALLAASTKPGWYYVKRATLGKTTLFDAKGKVLRIEKAAFYIGSTALLLYAGERYWIKHVSADKSVFYELLTPDQAGLLAKGARYLGEENKVDPFIRKYKAVYHWHRGSVNSDREMLLKLDIPKSLTKAPPVMYRGFNLPKKTVLALKRGETVNLKPRGKTTSLTDKAKVAAEFADYGDYGDYGVVVKFNVPRKDVVLNCATIIKLITGSANSMDFDNEGEVVVRNSVRYTTINPKDVVKFFAP